MADPQAQQNPENDREMQKAISRMYKQAQQEQQIKALMRQILDAQAYERMMNIKASNGELYMQLAQVMISLVQSRQVNGLISEQQFLSILRKVMPRHEPKVEFKHK